MLKKLTIRNFKAIEDMTIEFSPLTVLIGGNGCGKSTVLQALDFLSGIIAYRDLAQYLDDSDLYFDDLKSKYNNGKEKPIEFISTYEFDKNSKIFSLEWLFSVNKIDDKWLICEKIVNLNNNKILCSYHNSGIKDTPDLLGQIYLKSSALNIIDDMILQDFQLQTLSSFIHSVSNFGLLSLDKIHASPKYNPILDISHGGEYLFSTLYRMTEEKKRKLNSILSDLLGYKVEIETEKTASDQIGLWINETQSNSSASIHSKHISDGLMRIIAFLAIIITDEKIFGNIKYQVNGIILLDEIENGINPYLTEKIINLLQAVVKDARRQVVITTHSPIVLNDIDPDTINLLWKDKSGSVHCRKLFSIAELRDSLDFLYPGDALMNTKEEDLLSLASADIGDEK
jgi:AAA15 family ATPase/GTPase